jgi:hypothetical protein
MPRVVIKSWLDFAAHSVGTVIKKSLHERVGFYDEKYLIAADTLFVRSALRMGASAISVQEVVGHFSLNGVSSTDYLRTAIESYKIRLAMKENQFICVLRLVLGVIKNARRVIAYGLKRKFKREG